MELKDQVHYVHGVLVPPRPVPYAQHCKAHNIMYQEFCARCRNAALDAIVRKVIPRKNLLFWEKLVDGYVHGTMLTMMPQHDLYPPILRFWNDRPA